VSRIDEVHRHAPDPDFPGSVINVIIVEVINNEGLKITCSLQRFYSKETSL
jgi:hypothetical protein